MAELDPAAPAAVPEVPLQNEGGRAQRTTSEEARHSLRLKVKESTGKGRGGKSGAQSGNVILSSFPYIHLSDS